MKKDPQEIVAEWIAYDCEDTYDEVEYLLMQLYPEDGDKKVEDDYGDVIAIYRDKQKTKEK